MDNDGGGILALVLNGLAQLLTQPLFVGAAAVAAIAIGSSCITRAASAVAEGTGPVRNKYLVVGLVVGLVSAFPEFFLASYARLISAGVGAPIDTGAEGTDPSALPAFANWHMPLGLIYGSTIANLSLVLGLAAFASPIKKIRGVSLLDALFLLGAAAVPLALLLGSNVGNQVWALIAGDSQAMTEICNRGEGGEFEPTKNIPQYMLAAYAAFFVVSYLLFLFARARDDEEIDAVSYFTSARESTFLAVGGFGALLAGCALIILLAHMVWFGLLPRDPTQIFNHQISVFGIFSPVVDRPHPPDSPYFWSNFGRFFLAGACFLPELIAIVTMALRGRTDFAVSGIVGATIANLLLVLPAIALIDPLPLGRALNLDTVDGAANLGLGYHGGDCFSPMLPDVIFLPLLAIVVFIFMFTRFTLERREGLVLIAFYVLYVVITMGESVQTALYLTIGLFVLAVIMTFLGSGALIGRSESDDED